jgi:hypothetical protein
MHSNETNHVDEAILLQKWIVQLKKQSLTTIAMEAPRDLGYIIAPAHSWPRLQIGVSSQVHALASLFPGKGTPVPSG